MKNFDLFKKESLQDSAIKKECDALKLEYKIIEDIILKRIESGLTQI
ncbi:MAG TPA: hypothetical protein PLS49_07485 [Candidatus Woesebacteria bacterium]|nr:hypothetical protein [Candidatus Woesebacteria bacterium]